MILKNKLQVHLDIANNLVVVDEGASNVDELQQLSLQYVSQIQTMVAQNEKLVEFIGGA